eukprot:2494021-Amphidinium_carterae.1
MLVALRTEKAFKRDGLAFELRQVAENDLEEAAELTTSSSRQSVMNRLVACAAEQKHRQKDINVQLKWCWGVPAFVMSERLSVDYCVDTEQSMYNDGAPESLDSIRHLD